MSRPYDSWLVFGGVAAIVAVLALRLPWSDWADARPVPTAEVLRNAGLLPVRAAAIVRRDTEFHADRNGFDTVRAECDG